MNRPIMSARTTGAAQGCRRGAVIAAAVIIAVSGCSAPAPQPADGGGGPGRSTAAGAVPAEALVIMEKPNYAAARWSYVVADPETGEVLLAHQPDELVFTASTAKQFTVGAAYETLGPETRLSTEVFTTAGPDQGIVRGDLVLVASGDLALGGRGGLQGRMDHAFGPGSVDHVYGDIAPNARRVDQDPLAGLNDLARQIAGRGITAIDGDVIIDARIWEPFAGQEGPVPSIFVNDNLLDIEVTPGEVGATAEAKSIPATAAYTIDSRVKTVAAGTAGRLEVTPDPSEPRRLVVTGTIAAGEPRLTIHRVPDAESWARTLLVEALGRAGVRVTAKALQANDRSALPAAGSYRSHRRVAVLESPPLKAFGSMILQTSYNTGANALLCLLAVEAGSSDCTAGLGPLRTAIRAAGLDSDQVFLFDGQGADPASTTPRQLTTWIAWAGTRPWAAEFLAGQPVLGESGSLASSGAEHPAKGKIAAKTGTSLDVDPATGRVLFKVQSLAGRLTTDQGRDLVFAPSMSGGSFPDIGTGLTQAGNDVAMVAAAFQQQLSR